MNEKEQDYFDESLFQTLASTTTDKDSNDTPMNELEYRHGMTAPEARIDFPDITRDLMLSNLTHEELYVVRMKSSIIKDLQYINEQTGLGNDTLIKLFRHDREIILVSSLSRDGFLRENLVTQLRKFQLDRKKSLQKGKKSGLRVVNPFKSQDD